jgi:hypothetical protein
VSRAVVGRKETRSSAELGEKEHSLKLSILVVAYIILKTLSLHNIEVGFII